MRNNEKIVFLEEIIFGIDNGEGFDKILEAIIHYLPERSKAKVEKILESISHGKKLSSSLFEENILSKSESDFLAIGEDIGELRLYLFELINSIRSRTELIRKLINSLVYPSIILIIGLSLVIFLCVYIFPKISRIFISLKIDLPITTRLLLGFSNYVDKNLFLCISLLICGIVSILLIFYIRKTRLVISNILQVVILKTPYISGIYLSYWMYFIYSNLAIIVNLNSNYFGYISTMISSLPEILRDEYGVVFAELNKGGDLAGLLAHTEHLPGKYSGLLKMASKSGNFSKTLNNIAIDLRKEYMNRLTILLAIIEPLIIICLGIMVVIIALSVILPIYKVTGNINMK